MKTIRICFLLALLLPFGGCSDFLDINEDPNAATSADAEALFPVALANLAAVNSVEIGQNMQLHAQYWTSGGSASVFFNPETYSISDNTVENTWFSYYNNILKNLQLIIDDNEGTNAAAQAQIVAAHTYYALTSLWEDVPFREAVDPTVDAPRFDEQPEVLRGIVDQLDEALATIDPSGALAIENGDLIYGGDMSLWQRYANSLKLKTLLLLQSGGENVDGELAAVLSAPLIQDPADNAMIPFFEETNNANNLWKVLNLFSGNVNIWFGAAEGFVDLLIALDDPRLGLYFDPLQVEASPGQFVDSDPPEYVGRPVGEPSFDLNGEFFSYVSLNIIRRTWPERLATAGEILLYEAEVYAQQGDLSTADEKYRAGIRAHISWFDGQPGAIPGPELEAYVAARPDLATLSQAEAIRQIQLQQYIALFARTPEAWTNWRRTKVPDLVLPENALLGDVIRRYPYSGDEIASNPNAPDTQPALTLPMWFEGSN